MNNHHNIIIVAVGILGISCAKSLLEKEKNSLIISPEIGGRMRTNPFV